MIQTTVLVIEDDPDGQELIARMLFRAKIPVEVAGTAEDALQLISNKQHSVVVIDLALPGIDGFALLGEIKNNAALRNLPCIAITAFHTPALKKRALEEGFDMYFAKPLDDVRFIDAITTILQT